MAKIAQWQQEPTYSAREDDQLFDWIGGGIGRANGVGPAVFETSPVGLTVEIPPIQLIIPGTDITSQGSYLCTSDATDTFTMPPAPGTNKRIDVLYAQVLDAQYGRTGGEFDWFVEMGTVAATPVAPTVPSGSIPSALPIAHILREAGEGVIRDEAITTVVPRSGQMGYVVVSASEPSGPLAEGVLWIQTA